MNHHNNEQQKNIDFFLSKRLSTLSIQKGTEGRITFHLGI